ncbi:hypothetical protein OA098_03155, partial [Prochlorococcus sp. AH-736-B04]|nr:hypothetical protein [Prochlorococcus sp. AH-736-B04]
MAVQQLTINLSDIESGSDIGFVINGVDAGDYSGSSVSSAGDVNGDGIDDVIIGASNAAPNGEAYSGSTYVVFGTSDNDAIELSDIESGTGGFVINGVDEFDMSGISVSAAGDVNNDGLDDVIIGAVYADPNGSDSGSAYVVFGTTSTDAIELSDIESGTGGFVINGAENDHGADGIGKIVSAAGDVNGDGFDDVIIGDKYATNENGEESAGNSYIVFGKASTNAIEISSLIPNAYGVVINGADAGDSSGKSVFGAGDINGDGYDDVIISATGADPNGEYSGSTYVVFGNSEELSIDLSDIESQIFNHYGFVINGVDEDDSIGDSVAAGDINGDGLVDIIIGAVEADPNGEYSGSTYVVFGTSSTDAIELSDIESGTGGFVINGVDANDSSGYSVSVVGDINDDGLDDLIIGAYDADPNEINSGTSYVVFGTTSTDAIELSTLEEEGGGGFVINGVDENDMSGISVSAAGDVNGDNIPDLIIGASAADPNGSGSGASYIVFGADTISSSTDWSLGDIINNVTLSGSDNVDATGNSNANTLTGNTGNNILDGGAGDDTMSGGDGDDTYVVDSTSDSVTELASQGTDTIQSSVSWSLADNFENITLTGTDDINATGNSEDNTLTGNEGANNLDGGSGNDSLNGGLGDDILTGGVGTDTAVFSSNDNNVDLSNTNSQNTGDGTDTLSAIENVSGKGGNDIIIGNSGDNNLDGGSGDDTLTGGLGDDILTGGVGTDTLNGGSGDDTMSGGDGDDTYVVDSTSDTATENDSEGTDLIQTSVDWSLGDYFENLTLTGSTDINATGNSEENTLTGNDGNNILDGGTGDDTMSGGDGNDTYVVDSTSDTVTENSSEGTDLIQASVTYTASSNIENLTLTGSTDINATGNSLDNILTGNEGTNTLDGGGGDDTLTGGLGEDILTGGVGTDTLNGGLGDDLLIGGSGK